MKRIIIIGSRRRNEISDYNVVLKAFLELYRIGDIIISRGCPKGGDNFAERISAVYKIPMIIFPADWKRFGRGAGFIRNTDIAKNGDVLIACVTPDRKGGTEDTIKKFRKFKPEGEVILLH